MCLLVESLLSSPDCLFNLVAKLEMALAEAVSAGLGVGGPQLYFYDRHENWRLSVNTPIFIYLNGCMDWDLGLYLNRWPI
jgi:hypothetical protein